jgi:hypothetical protein
MEIWFLPEKFMNKVLSKFWGLEYRTPDFFGPTSNSFQLSAIFYLNLWETKFIKSIASTLRNTWSALAEIRQNWKYEKMGSFSENFMKASKWSFKMHLRMGLFRYLHRNKVKNVALLKQTWAFLNEMQNFSITKRK